MLIMHDISLIKLLVLYKPKTGKISAPTPTSLCMHQIGPNELFTCKHFLLLQNETIWLQHA